MTITHILSQKQFNEAIKKPAAVIDFHASWCGPCKRLTPALKDLAKEHGKTVKFYSVDIDDNASLADKLRISAVPTIFFYKEGKLVKKETGVNIGKIETALSTIL